MSKRTRLDEIVEEELRTNHVYRDSAQRIAERAFRHGVWQTQKLVLPALEKVQPAPAERECGDCHAPNCWCRRKPPKTWMSAYHGDERHGERRKGLGVEEHIAQFGGLGVIYRTRQNTWPWYPDRRAGKERRK